MSLKDRFANHSDTPAEQPQPEEQKSVELYDSPGHARNICFVQADGSMTFLNYAYLVCVMFSSSENIIQLDFTSKSVTISGRNLEKIIHELDEQKIRNIRESDQRYLDLVASSDIFISKIKYS